MFCIHSKNRRYLRVDSGMRDEMETIIGVNCIFTSIIHRETKVHKTIKP